MAKLDPQLLNNYSTLVNLSNSILAHYGLETFHGTIPFIDSVLKGHRKVAVFLFDGLGRYPLECHPKAGAYMLEHAAFVIQSVNPPTTAAATTSFLTGKFPVETGWIGWAPYQKEYDLPITLFGGKNYYTKEVVADPFFMYKKCPIKKIDALLNEEGVKAKIMMQKDLAFPESLGDGPENLKEFREKANAFFKEGGEFLYGYWTEPDHSIHEFGVKAKEIDDLVKEINATVKQFVRENPDVLVLTIADHGLLDVAYRDLKDEKEIKDTLLRSVTNEGRCPCFYVKKGMEDAFVKAFKKRFFSFALLTREEILECKYFGEGPQNPELYDQIGDFVAIALGNEVIYDSSIFKDAHICKGHHAGGCPEEKDIIVGIYNR